MSDIAKREIGSNNEIYFQSLFGHIYDSLKILKTYFDENYDTLIYFCNYWKIDSKLFFKNLFIFIYFHDLGKLIQEFQLNILKGQFSNNFPHAIYSFYLLSNFKYSSVLSLDIELLSVLAHHTQLYSTIYEDFNNIPTFEKEEISTFIKGIERIYDELNFETYFKLNKLEFNPNFKFNYIKFFKNRSKYINESSRFQDKILLKSVFCYFFSILQICDDYSSYNFNKYIKDISENNNHIFNNVLINAKEYILNINPDKFFNKIFGYYTLYEFQKTLLTTDSIFSLLFAPCGRGKTEASLGWALHIMKKFNKNKIVFAMPTQVTSNAMYERLCKIFGYENVGLYHGKSFIKLNDIYSNRNSNKIFSEVFKGNVFFKPITVTTIDHIIFSFVHGFSQSDFALGNLQNSIIIFDEVHYYDEKTLNHLYTLYKILVKMNIPHLLMSGTLPNFFMNSFKGYDKIIDYEGLQFNPFKISYNKNFLVETKNFFDISENLVNEILKNYNNGLKQFFIFNTIERAKTFYFKLMEIKDDLNIVLYHSQFTHVDRVKKENEIIKNCSLTNSFILVSTQIIEISLDISADVMYTELAPPDALGQRGGRLNRNKKSGVYEMKIFEPESHMPYSKDIIDKTRIYLKEGNMTYMLFKNWCDEVYVDKKLEESNLINFFNDSVLFGNHPKDIAFSEDQGNKLEIRDSSFQKVDVIPVEIYKNNKKNLIVENQVKIPLWWIKNDEDENMGIAKIFFNEINGNNQYIISKMKYTYEYGFDKNNIINFDDFDEFSS